MKRIFISFAVSAIVVILTLNFSDSYLVEVTEKETSSALSFYYYHDLDHDDTSEKLYFQKKQFGKSWIIGIQK